METQKTKITKAINEIVTYNTLPSQIDYQVPYQIKAMEAEEFLHSLTAKECANAEKIVEKQINDYYAPAGIDENGQEFSIASLNDMF